ncbi:MAG: metallophosphoesterase [Xanthomonadaceae bacterium]|nr:metallophosphoesterase [Xanthomonadaceae bacterium]
MNKWRILVIDDKAESKKGPGERQAVYKELESHSYEQKNFSVEFAKDEDDARSKINENEYDLVLLDVMLKDWGDDKRGTTFKDLLRKADKRHAVGLVSGSWDKTSITIVRDFLNHAHEVSIPLMFTFNDFKSKECAAMATQIVGHVRRRRKTYRLEVGPDDDLRILHLSDLHFGSDDAQSIFANPMSTKHLFDQIHKKWDKGPHLVAVTGDIGDKGHPGDYRLAYEWFGRLANEFGLTLPSPQILMVPGNHDFSVPLAGAKLLHIDRSTKKLVMREDAAANEDHVLSEFSMQPFDRFARDVSATHVNRGWHSNGWVEAGFREYGVVFSGLNTSKFCDDRAWPIRAIDDSDLFEVRNSLSSFSDGNRSSNLLHIALCHHSPIRYKTVDEYVDKGSIESFDQYALQGIFPPRVILHGHQHGALGHPFETGSIVYCSPTPSKKAGGRAEDSPRGVNLLALTRRNSVVTRIEGSFLHKRVDGWWVDPIPGTNAQDF